MPLGATFQGHFLCQKNTILQKELKRGVLLNSILCKSGEI